MKFRLNAAIAIYVLFTLLFTHASDKKGTYKDDSIIPANQHKLISFMIKYIPFIEKNCKDVSIDENMIIHFKYGEVSYWFDLKEFLDQAGISNITFQRILYKTLPRMLEADKKNLPMVYTFAASAAVLQNGDVIAWGDENFGGKIPEEIKPQLNNNVTMLYSTQGAFAALLKNGDVIAWGHKYCGGKIPEEIKPQLKKVKMIFANEAAFVALLYNDSVFAWGNFEAGGRIPDNTQAQINNDVEEIVSNSRAFAARLENGNVIAWGDKYYGGKIPDDIQSKLKNVTKISSTPFGFEALCENGETIKWEKVQTHASEKKDLIRSRLIPANQHNFISLMIKNILFLRKKCKDVSIDKNMIIHFKYEEVNYWFNLNYFLLQSYRTVFNIGEADQNYAILPRNNAFIDRIVAIMKFEVKMIISKPPREYFYEQHMTHWYLDGTLGMLHAVWVDTKTNEHYESEPPQNNYGNYQ